MKKNLQGLLISLICLACLANCTSSVGAGQAAADAAKVIDGATLEETHQAEANIETAIPEITPTAQPTPTQEPVHSVLLFEEDFLEGGLDWKAQDGLIDASPEGIAVENPVNEKASEYMGLAITPQKSLLMYEDCTIQVKFSNKVRFSGLIINPSDNYYAFIIGSGSLADFPPGYANLGLLRLSLGDKAWDTLGDIDNLVPAFDDEITLKVVFLGDEAQVFINDKFIASRQDEVFKEPKFFGGFYLGNGDKFTVKEIKVWGNSPDMYRIR